MRGAVVQKPKGTGRWYVVLDLDRDGTGHRRQKWHSGFRTKREAEKGLTALLAAQDTGTHVAPQKITLGEYLAERWLPAIEATVGRRHSPATERMSGCTSSRRSARSDCNPLRRIS